MDFFTTQPPWYIALGLLLVALLVGLSKAYRLWQDMNDDDEPATDHERLSELEEAHFAGELDADELRRVRELLSRSNAGKIAEPPKRRPPVAPEAPPSTPASNDSSEAPH